MRSIAYILIFLPFLACAQTTTSFTLEGVGVTLPASPADNDIAILIADGSEATDNDTVDASGAQSIIIPGLDRWEIDDMAVGSVVTLKYHSTGSIWKAVDNAPQPAIVNLDGLTMPQTIDGNNTTLRTVANGSLQFVDGSNSSALGLYLVPAGKTLYIKEVSTGMQNSTSSSSADIQVFVKEAGGVFVLYDQKAVNNSGSSYATSSFSSSLMVSAGNLLKCRASASTNNSNITVFLSGYLIAD